MSRKVVVVYAMKRQVTIKAHWPFYERVREVAQQVFPLLLRAELASAMASARG